MIMKGRTALRLPMAGLIALGLMAAGTLPAWATAQQQTPPVPPPPATTPRPVPEAAPLPPPAPATTPRPAPEAAPLPPPPPAVEIAVEPPQPGPSWRTRPPTRAGQTVRTPPRVQPGFVYSWNYESELPADGQKLIESFKADSKAIREEADRKIDERREAVVKALQSLQEQYTKAGKLDEALAIRDYLRVGGPPRDNLFQFWVDRR